MYDKRYLLVAFLLLLAVPAQALDLGMVKVNGFVSQGYLQSEDNNFLADSIDGTTEYNEVGLTISAQPYDKLRVGMQLLSRDLGPEGNNEIRLDWGFADYRFADFFGVRAGKVKLPYGLYNEGRDSDFLRITALLPQSIYDETRRTMLVSTQGAGLYGNIPVGVLGDFDYQFAYGETNFPDDSVLLEGFVKNFNQAVAPKPLAPLTAASDVDADNQYLYAGNLIYNTPLAGLRLAGSYVAGKTELQFNNIYGTQVGTGEVGMKDMWVVSAEYTSSLVDLATEYTEYKNTKKFNNVEAPGGTSLGWYGLLALHATDTLHVYGLYDVFYADKDDRAGRAFAVLGQKPYMGWRKDVGVGIRYDINPSWLIKAEWHDVNGVGSNAGLFNNVADLEKNWNYYIVKTSFNF